MNIPRIICSVDERGACAAFGLSLTAIRPEALLLASDDTTQLSQLWKNAHERNVRLLQVLARWPHKCSVELHIVTHPSLDGQKPGWNEIGVLFRVRARDQADATELTLSDSIHLNAILGSFWPSAEFSNIETGEFQRYFYPFSPQSCLRVRRRSERICPAHPFAAGKLPIGFQTETEAHGSSQAGCLETSIRHVYPWVPPCGESWSFLLDSLLRLPTPRWILVRMTNDPTASVRGPALERLANTVEVCERLLAGSENGQMTMAAQSQLIRDASLTRYAQLMDGSISGCVLVFAPGKADTVTANVVGQSITGDHSRRQIEGILDGGFCVDSLDPLSAVNGFECLEDEPFSLEESACAFRLPIVGSQHDLGLIVRRCRTVEIQLPPARKASSYIQLGLNLHRGVARTIRVTTEDQLHHALYIGATGTGKSTLITNSLIEQARVGRAGLALIDPSGATADDFLEHFPKERMDDLIIVDFEDREFPVPLNLLLWKSVEERDLLIDTLYSTLLSTYKSPDYFGPVFETYFRSGLRLLLGDQPRADFTPTLLELPQVFRSPNFRKYLVADSQDDDVKDAIEEANRVSGGDLRLENVAPYVTSKLNRFLQDTQLRRIVGHGGMALDFRDIMDSGKIVVFKLAQGRLGAHAAGILTAQIVARFRLAAMSRADIPYTERRPFILYCDEAHAVCDENVADMLSQCRKYSLGLVLATQYARQLHDKGVLQAVLGNVGTIAVFRVSPEDASLLEPVFSPVIGAQDLIESPSWNGYMRIHSSQTPSRPFSFCTVRSGPASDPELARELREKSRRKWGVSAKNIDEEIQTRRKVIKDLARRPLLKVALPLEESMPEGIIVPVD